MAEFKFVVSDPETRKSYQKSIDQSQAIGLVGKRIGDEISGDVIMLSGFSLKITGGTDKDGFPMHPSVRGSVKKRILLASAPGFHPKLKGQRKRKMVRGDTISQDIVQINIKVIKKGEKSLDELIPMKPKEKKPEEKKEVKTEQKPEQKQASKQESSEAKKETKPEPKPTEQPAKTEEKEAHGGAKTN